MLKAILKILLSVLIIVIVFCGFYFYKIDSKDIKINNSITIDKGESLNSILEKFEVKNKLMAKIYVKLNKADRKLKAGFYVLDGKYSIVDIFSYLEKGMYKRIEVVFPEGIKLAKVKEILDENKLVSKKRFEEILKNKRNFPYFIEKGYEGYFFPDTYYFYEGQNDEEIIDVILSRFLELFPPEKYSDQEEFYEKLILASIIEKEAYHNEEKPIMASVFKNRISKDMRLESCATIQYLLDYKIVNLTNRELRIDSPYNTYKYKGLPPTPISNPGLEAINAALNPIDSEFLFFILDENNRHSFSKTYKEHLIKKRKRSNK